MPIIETLYGNVFYAEHKGDSPFPLILIHGAASSHLGWPAELRRFGGYRVLTIDLPGHGRAKGKSYNEVSAYANTVLGLMDSLDIEKALLVGHSMGGAISQYLAFHHLGRTVGIILIGTGAYLPVNPFILENVLTDKQTVATKISQWSWKKSATSQLQALGLKALLEVSAEVIHDDYTACANFDMREDLAEIHVPALVVGARLDKMTPIAYSEFLAAHLPQATLKIVEDAGHWMILEQPKVVEKYVSEWLAKTVPQK